MEACLKNEAFVTLATNDSYAVGALVVGSSLKAAGTSRSLVVMITNGVSQNLRQSLDTVFNLVSDVNILDSKDIINLKLLTRPELGVTFTKLHCWRLTQFTKCVFLDSDTVVLQNIDDLFDHDELSAAPDIGWPDCFNSGVFVYRPSLETYSALLNLSLTQGSFDGGDQGLLNSFFSDWATKDIKKRLSFVYNVVSQEFYTYQPAFKQFGKNAKVVHFIGTFKPWHATYNKSTGEVNIQNEYKHRMEYLQFWWKIFTERIEPYLDSSVVEQMSSLNICTEQKVIDEQRHHNWERGQIDYLGSDSFDGILSRLDAAMSSSSTTSHLDAAISPSTELSSASVKSEPVQEVTSQVSVKK